MAQTLTATEASSDRPIDRRRIAADANKLSIDDHAAHDWYRFVLSYPPHLVRDYLKRRQRPKNGEPSIHFAQQISRCIVSLVSHWQKPLLQNPYEN